MSEIDSSVAQNTRAAARALNVDFDLLRLTGLIPLTRNETKRRQIPGDLGGTYENNLSALNLIALQFASKGRIIDQKHSMTIVMDAPGMPLGGGGATTLGNYVFIKAQWYKDSESIMSHEFIHTLQGAAQGANYWKRYLLHFPFHLGGPTQKEEAIAYLWQGYMEAYGVSRLKDYGQKGPWAYFSPLTGGSGGGY